MASIPYGSLRLGHCYLSLSMMSKLTKLVMLYSLRGALDCELMANNAFAIVSIHADGRLELQGFGQQPSVELQLS